MNGIVAGGIGISGGFSGLDRAPAKAGAAVYRSTEKNSNRNSNEEKR
jgi:uncharacterized protein GlcG (DUF336 family)